MAWRWVKRWSCLVGITLLVTGCSTQKNQAPEAAESEMERIYVESYDFRETVAEEDTLQVEVKGNLPSPAYTFSRFEVSVSNGIIEITPLARYNPNKVVAQMLVPFSQTCPVTGLEPGTYEVKVVGRGESSISGRQVRVTK